jgi:D-alanyl-D-alanine carboxypeptidase
MFSAVEYTVPKTNKKDERRIVTSNYLMSKETVKTQYDSRVTGGKTGALSTTDRSLICTAENSGKRYLVVLMSARGTVTEDGLSVKTFGSFEETRTLLDFGFYQFSYRQVLQSGQVLGQFPVEGAENAAFAGPGVDLYSALPVEVNPDQISFRCVLDKKLSAPMEAGEVIGTAEVWYQDVCVGYTQLLLLHPLRAADEQIQSIIPSAQLPQGQALRNWLILGGLILAGLLLIACIVFVVILLVRKHQINSRHKLINEGMDR